jgi:hypothetical protein
MHAASGYPHEHANKPTNHKQKKRSFSGPAVRGYHYGMSVFERAKVGMQAIVFN